MGIRLACACGQRFVAKDSLSGKAVLCPKCRVRLKIPDAGHSGQPTSRLEGPGAELPEEPALTGRDRSSPINAGNEKALRSGRPRRREAGR